MAANARQTCCEVSPISAAWRSRWADRIARNGLASCPETHDSASRSRDRFAFVDWRRL